MAFFPDLWPCPYWGVEGRATEYVGWLEDGEPFPVGETSQQFRDQLELICRQPAGQTRGYHYCPFCKRMAGSAEIRVVGTTKVFIAPDLVEHYIVVHRYKPPEEFIAAVLASNEY